MPDEMLVQKRDGSEEEMSFDKITKRVREMCELEIPSLGLDKLTLPSAQLVMQVVSQLYSGIPTSEIDRVTAEQCASLCTQALDYGRLAARIVISNHHKGTTDKFSEIVEAMANFEDVNGKLTPMCDDKLLSVTRRYADTIDRMIDYDRDYLIDYFGFKTLERAYLMKVGGMIVERPQHVWMRVAIGIHGSDLSKVKETYDLMSQKYFTHATPTLFNAGTPHPQLSSCYLVSMEDDSIDGIFNTVKECAMISKWAGGVGLHVHNVRGTGSHIRGTNGRSNGLVPMLRVFNSTARYVDQGGGKRNGSIAIYLEPWHPDIIEWLDLKKNHGDEELRARDLFYALWVSDLFMEKVRDDEDWNLFCPDSSPGLSEAHGEEFRSLYSKYTVEGRAVKTVKARDIWLRVLDSQMETGTPYLLFKDAANRKSNQKNLGTIKSSNLCTEIMEYSDSEQTAVCNLASIGLSRFVTGPAAPSGPVKIYTKERCKWCTRMKALLKTRKIEYTEVQVAEADFDSFKEAHGVSTVPQLYIGDTRVGGFDASRQKFRRDFDFEELYRVTGIVTRNLDRVIDINFYPTEKTRRSNFLHRPIGIGVQGLADVFAMMDMPFDSPEARQLNKDIFETIYHASLRASCNIAIDRKDIVLEAAEHWDQSGRPSHEKHMPVCMGVNCAEMEAVLDNAAPAGAYSSFTGSPASQGQLQFDMWGVEPSGRHDWKSLKEDIVEYGLRNSLLLAPMPTASTSQILGNNECFEPFTSNIYSRRTIAGDYVVVNRHLMEELESIGVWSSELKDMIVKNRGSVQDIDGIPDDIKQKFKIVWEIPMRALIDMAADRGAFICQSQSLNLWLEDPDYKTLTSMHFYSWKKGLKTGLYYLRRKPKHQPQQFTIAPPTTSSVGVDSPSDHKGADADEECLMCSS